MAEWQFAAFSLPIEWKHCNACTDLALAACTLRITLALINTLPPRPVYHLAIRALPFPCITAKFVETPSQHLPPPCSSNPLPASSSAHPSSLQPLPQQYKPLTKTQVRRTRTLECFMTCILYDSPLFRIVQITHRHPCTHLLLPQPLLAKVNHNLHSTGHMGNPENVTKHTCKRHVIPLRM